MQLVRRAAVMITLQKTMAESASGRWRIKLGCSLCAKAGLEGPWANFEQTPTSVLKKHNLERHEKSKGHMTASQDDLCGAPSDEAFKSSLQGMTQGQSARQGGGSSDKKLKCGMPSRKQFVLATGLCWQSLAASH